MAEMTKDVARERRIWDEILVDAYGEEERALGWCYYLEEHLAFPFRARCIRERRISPLCLGEEVQAIGLLPEEECAREMFVEIEWSGRRFGVPLAQLEALDTDPETCEAMEDWRYWVGRGYEF
jgi:hypothetical protein